MLDSARRRPDGHYFRRTSPIRSLDENVRINKGLWALAQAQTVTSLDALLPALASLQ